jgi:hypothetical protein
MEATREERVRCIPSPRRHLASMHRANVPSSGHETRTAIEVFLNTRPYGPERQALLAVLGVGDDTQDSDQQSYGTSALYPL